MPAAAWYCWARMLPRRMPSLRAASMFPGSGMFGLPHHPPMPQAASLPRGSPAASAVFPLWRISFPPSRSRQRRNRRLSPRLPGLAPRWEASNPEPEPDPTYLYCAGVSPAAGCELLGWNGAFSWTPVHQEPPPESAGLGKNGNKTGSKPEGMQPQAGAWVEAVGYAVMAAALGAGAFHQPCSTRAYVHQPGAGKNGMTRRGSALYFFRGRPLAWRAMMAGKYIALPKGVSENTFDAAINAFRDVLGGLRCARQRGAACALYQNHDAGAGCGPHAFRGADGHDCGADPEDCGHLQPIQSARLDHLNREKSGLWLRGPGRARPGRARSQAHEPDSRSRQGPGLCPGRAGVTYKQLYDYIAEHKLGLWLSVPAPSAIAGPVGNTLDRGVGYTPYGEHFMFACGMEVVLANGEVLRTGMGSLPNSNTWQVFKWGYGPYLDGIFTQSNYGIVTKFGFWLMPAPPVSSRSLSSTRMRKISWISWKRSARCASTV